MFGFWKDTRERWLLVGALFALVLLVIVKVKLEVPESMKGPEWATWVSFFQAKAFEDIVGDLLTGLIAAYFFYVLIDLLPRHKNEKKSLGILNLLIASVIQAYDKRHFFAHTMAVTQADVTILTKERIDAFLEEVKERPDYAKLKCALFTAHSRFADFQQTLSIASPLGPDRALQWLVITDKVRLLVDEYENHPESEVYRPSQVFYDDTVDLDQDHKDFIRYFSDMEGFRDSLKFCFYEYLEEIKKWIAPEDAVTDQPQPVDIDATTAPETASAG